MRQSRILPFSSLHLTSSIRLPRACIVSKWLYTRSLSCTPPVSQLQQYQHQPEDNVPLRKHLKDEKRRKKLEKGSSSSKNGKSSKDALDSKWELTVGIEIHAELNTATKLFSPARTDDVPGDGKQQLPNSKVALFDAAIPGSQPTFQTATLLPALRAAIALECQVQRRSTWDRKHYFHWDQPNGYQLTQYYEPFAKNGRLCLTAEDGVPASDLNGAHHLVIGVKQVQMEQDTAKTMHHPPHTYHIDLDRAGHPLIEIITLPHIHSPQTAAAVVRKVQAVLKSVDACVVGMESGGLRADVNVSVRQRDTKHGGLTYGGVEGLGQRTEIKNLSSFKAVEDAIVAERDRQIAILESGGVVEGETRGWTLGATETTRLRGKEGEVDYRYMPDPDLPPLFIAVDLIDHLKSSLPELPEETADRVQKQYGLSSKDARSLILLDNGDRLDFMEETVELVMQKTVDHNPSTTKVGKTVGNWVLHELGGLLTTSGTTWEQVQITPNELSDIICNVLRKEITARVAKQVLASLHDTSGMVTRPTVEELIDRGNLRLRPLSEGEYLALAARLIDENPDMVSAIKEKGQRGKIMWFVGQMLRQADEGTIEPEKAEGIFEKLLGT